MYSSFEIKGVRFGQGRPVICVPVVERERDAVIAKIRVLIAKGVRMIEWRVDCFGDAYRPEEVRAVLSEIREDVESTVMLFTVRTKRQGGNSELPERELLYLNEIAAKSGSIDIVDYEYFEGSRPERDIPRLQRMGVRVIASHHDFARTPDDPVLYQIMDHLARGGGDIAKLAVMPESVDDLIRLLRLSNDTVKKYPGLPLITIAMGDLGVVSRVTGEVFGSCVTFGADGEGSAPGQLRFDRLGDILDALHDGMKRPALSGHIYLIGFMGTGKTTVSAELTGRTGAEGIDLDDEIVRENGMSITEMFDRYGEEYFRERETAALCEVAGRDPAVISCGGGCVLRKENVAFMRQSGTTILLTADPETVYRRVKDDTGRPILNGHMDTEYIAGLMEQRRPAYEAACDVSVSTDGKTPGQIAEEILREISE